ncbi:MAG TPA: phosphatase PAP2 family protein [Gemmatimonadales bacterium]|nr:phosphatase PAP2 family protein [Gemmatimonadales bacterium]
MGTVIPDSTVDLTHEPSLGLRRMTTPDTEAPRQPWSEGRSLNRFTTTLLIGYLAFIVVLMIVRRSTLSPEVFVVFAAVIAVLMGRGWSFVRDWAPFALILLAWQLARGLADDIGARVQSDAAIAVERAISFGTVPSVELQKWLHIAGRTTPLDVAMTVVYLLHFLLPLVAAFLLWVFRRHLYYRYAMALILLSVAQFFTAVILPVAPPRFAGLYGEALAVTDISYEVTQNLQLGTLSWAYLNLNGNPVAAFLRCTRPIPCLRTCSCALPGGAPRC